MQLVTGPRSECDHGWFNDHHGRTLFFLKLRHMFGSLRAGFGNPVGVVHFKHCNCNVEWNLNGFTARCGRRSALQTSQSVSFINNNSQRDRQQRDDQRCRKSRNWLAQPAAVFTVLLKFDRRANLSPQKRHMKHRWIFHLCFLCLFGLCLKVRSCSEVRSVPPAIAGGSTKRYSNCR